MMCGWSSQVASSMCPPPSHTRTVVRECFKGDEASQWKRPKFDPSPHQNPLTDLHKLTDLIKSWMAPGIQNFVAIGSGVFAPQIRDFSVLLGNYSFFVFWVLQYSNSLHPWTDFYAKYVKWRRSRYGSAFWGFQWLYFIFRPLNLKNRHFWDRFWLYFLRPKIVLTWGCSNIKLPLIVVVAP